jgi:uncharacterized cupin superfamily protein
MSAVQIAKISMDVAKPIFGQPDNIRGGNPTTTTRDCYTDKSEHFYSGMWTCTPGSWNFTNVGEEFCYLISGKVKLIPDEGQVSVFGAGEAFVIPHGWKGTWEAIEPITKYYVVMTPKSAL